MIRTILAWGVLVAMAVGTAVIAVSLWNACRPAACVLIGADVIVFGFLLVWALELIGWL